MAAIFGLGGTILAAIFDLGDQISCDRPTLAYSRRGTTVFSACGENFMKCYASFQPPASSTCRIDHWV